MRIFITGTDTDVGKTLVSSWLCLHSDYKYFKPIQTGNTEETDTEKVKKLGILTHEEIYSYKEPLSPHLAARLENDEINMQNIILPKENDLIVEGAGGVLVPINKSHLMVDLMCKFSLPIILVARSALGTINHTLLSIEALRARKLNILGVILNGPINIENAKAIEFYGNIKILAQIPKLESATKENLLDIPLTTDVRKILEGK